MSLLPPLFLRGERMRPLGSPRRLLDALPAPEPTRNDWDHATASDKPPKKVRLHLTDWAQDAADDFYKRYGDGNCSCHISPPCGSCTHHGNPLNLEETDDAWVMGYQEQQP